MHDSPLRMEQGTWERQAQSLGFSQGAGEAGRAPPSSRFLLWPRDPGRRPDLAGTLGLGGPVKLDAHDLMLKPSALTEPNTGLRARGTEPRTLKARHACATKLSWHRMLLDDGTSAESSASRQHPAWALGAVGGSASKGSGPQEPQSWAPGIPGAELGWVAGCHVSLQPTGGTAGTHLCVWEGYGGDHRLLP